MAELMTDEALCTKGFAALEERLGPVHALRFLAMISRESFDYQKWRSQQFGEMSLDEILGQARKFAH